MSAYLPPPFVWWIVGGLIAAAITIWLLRRAARTIGNLARLATSDDDKARARRHAAREALSTAWMYGLLYGFWAVAAGLSMGGLTGFAKDNMGIGEPWNYLLFLALDGAAAFCMVLVTRRAGRAASTLTPRLAVWGLVAASSWFNHTHAADLPGGKLAWAIIPIIAGVLFELAQSETRNKASREDRRITAIQWLHPIERTRVLLELAADTEISADEATIRVRDAAAAVWLYRLRTAWRPFKAVVRWRTRVATARGDFSDPARAEEILRRTQILARVDDFAAMDFRSAVPSRLALANLIGSEADSESPTRSIVKGKPLVIAGAVEPLPILASATALNRDLHLPSIGQPKSITGGVNGHHQNDALNGPETALHGEGVRQPEEQSEEQRRTRKRAGRRTYERINPTAEQYVADAVLQGREITPQELLQKFRNRSRSWAENRIREGIRKADQIRASHDGGTPSTSGQ